MLSTLVFGAGFLGQHGSMNSNFICSYCNIEKDLVERYAGRQCKSCRKSWERENRKRLKAEFSSPAVQQSLFECTTCNKTFQNSERYRPFEKKCKPCFKEWERQYRVERGKLPEVKQQRARIKKKYNSTAYGKQKQKEYKEANKEKISRQNSQWFQKNKEKKRKQGIEWIRQNPERYKELVKRQNKKRREDPVYAFGDRLRSLMRSAWYDIDQPKPGKTFELLGYSHIDLYTHLLRFLNQACLGGCGTILVKEICNIDHILPLASAKTSEDILRLNRLENLRLLCEPCNLHKISQDLKYIKAVRSGALKHE